MTYVALSRTSSSYKSPHNHDDYHHHAHYHYHHDHPINIITIIIIIINVTSSLSCRYSQYFCCEIYIDCCSTVSPGKLLLLYYYYYYCCYYYYYYFYYYRYCSSTTTTITTSTTATTTTSSTTTGTAPLPLPLLYSLRLTSCVIGTKFYKNPNKRIPTENTEPDLAKTYICQ